MAYYRKKPVTVQAVRFLKRHINLAECFNETPTWLIAATQHGKICQTMEEEELTVRTLNGLVVVKPGEWIVLGIEGELYPCNDKIFQETYDFVSITKPEELEEEED